MTSALFSFMDGRDSVYIFVDRGGDLRTAAHYLLKAQEWTEGFESLDAPRFATGFLCANAIPYNDVRFSFGFKEERRILDWHYVITPPGKYKGSERAKEPWVIARQRLSNTGSFHGTISDFAKAHPLGGPK